MVQGSWRRGFGKNRSAAPPARETFGVARVSVEEQMSNYQAGQGAAKLRLTQPPLHQSRLYGTVLVRIDCWTTGRTLSANSLMLFSAAV